MGVVGDLVGFDVQRLIGRTRRRPQQLARNVVHDPPDHAVDDMLERLDRLPDHLGQDIADQRLLHDLADLGELAAAIACSIATDRPSVTIVAAIAAA